MNFSKNRIRYIFHEYIEDFTKLTNLELELKTEMLPPFIKIFQYEPKILSIVIEINITY